MGLFRKSESREVEVLERRDPRAATQNVRWVTPDKAQAPDFDAQEAFERAYYMSVTCYACVRLLANTVGSMEFRAGLDPAKPNDYNPNARLAQLLGPPPGGPAPKLSARRLWAWTAAQRRVTGRNGWEIEMAGDQVAALWPLASSYLKPKPSQGGTEWFSGFEYGRRGEEKTLDGSHIVYDWDPSGTDFRQPESPLMAANLNLAVEVMQSRYDFAFLKNDARPPAIVVTEQFEDDDSFQAFKQQWNSQYAGPDNAGRVAFLEATGSGDQGVKGAVDVTVLGISPKDQQAAQRHAAAMTRVAMALGTPWSLLDASGRTFDNASQEWKNYITHTVLPFIADFQDMVNMQLAPMVGNEVGWFDLSRLGIKEMDRLDAQGVATLYEAGIISRTEGRAPFGLPSIDSVDKFAEPPAPVAATPIKIAASAPEDEVRAMHAFVDGGDGTCAECGKPMMHQAHGYFTQSGFMPMHSQMPGTHGATMPRSARGSGALVHADAPEGPAPDRSLSVEVRRSKLWNTAQGRVKVLERQWERAIRKLFARQSRSVVARLEGKRGRSLATRDARAAADEVFDPKHWISETIDDVGALYEAVTAAGGMRVAEQFGLDFDLEAAYAQDFIKARANQLAGQVTETTYEAVKDALAQGVGEGESIPKLADRLRAVFDQASETRAVTIARTEVISGFNGSASLTAAQYGADVVGGQEWIATRDARTRESHAEMDGEVVGMDEAFSNGLAYPGDPGGDAGEVVNCRCTVAFLAPDEMTDRAPKMIERRVARALFSAWDGRDHTVFARALVEAA